MDTIELWLSNPLIITTIKALLIVLVIIILLRIINRYIIRKLDNDASRYVLKKIVNTLGYVIIIAVLVSLYSGKLGQVAVAFGVAGAGIAFALQEVIISLAGWLAIMFGDFYKAGDRIELGGIKGDVIDIGILRTTLMEIGERVDGDQYNGRIVRVANSFVFKQPVYNYSGDFPFIRDEITVPIDYGSNYEAAREIIQKAADDVVGEYTDRVRSTRTRLVHKFLIEDAALDPVVTLVANDNRVEFTLRYVVEYKKRRSTKDRIFSNILIAAENEHDDVSFASATMKIVDSSGLHIKTDD